MTTHVFLPDFQITPNSATAHIRWIAAEIEELQPEVIVHAGDLWDLPSLSTWDQGTIKGEGARFSLDAAAGNYALAKLDSAIDRVNEGRRARKKKLYSPKKVITEGNHEHRIDRVVAKQPNLQGTLSRKAFNAEALGWEWVPFLKPIEIDGIYYCHYFCRNAQGQVVQSRRGQSSARLQVMREGRSCTAGHQQGLSFHLLQRQERIDAGIIAGSCYLDDFDYLTPQGTKYWRGIVVKTNVRDGEFSPHFVSLDELCMKHEGVPLDVFMKSRKYNKELISDIDLERYDVFGVEK